MSDRPGGPTNVRSLDDALRKVRIAEADRSDVVLDLQSLNPYSGPVATFTDANPYAPVSDFTATIDWGDGTPPTTGVVTGPVGGPFTVSGSHEYATLGPKVIEVYILDEGGADARATTHLLLYALSSGGNFVIGDQNAAVGTEVTYWGAQWWKLNGLSGLGIEVVGRKPLHAPINAHNRRYMTAKAMRAGHKLDHLITSLAEAGELQTVVRAAEEVR